MAEYKQITNKLAKSKGSLHFRLQALEIRIHVTFITAIDAQISFVGSRNGI